MPERAANTHTCWRHVCLCTQRLILLLQIEHADALFAAATDFMKGGCVEDSAATPAACDCCSVVAHGQHRHSVVRTKPAAPSPTSQPLWHKLTGV